MFFTTDYGAKIKDIKDKVPSITNLATTATLNAVGKKIPDVSTPLKQILMKK